MEESSIHSKGIELTLCANQCCNCFLFFIQTESLRDQDIDFRGGVFYAAGKVGLI